ncbi:3-oxoacyl-(acyl-carrier-protein) synthase 3 [uncultured Desulfobacterium sp.]|uniref:Beta-ketoacyl-[acyl-carrier-protein] synthase III n=1 Tax=uncultured Desulfobacterium sp. TaxID=201089 RepID=A0A445MUM9_9BACT|nr:3-oxoacyl-(acyl-carrier-protein) synthase 3 [uncultured Desulfobacterium sp.]
MPKAHIVGTGSSVPRRVLTNFDLETIVDTSDKWITRRTGIVERRICSSAEKEGTADLGAQAALKAMEMAGIAPKDLDMIVVGTVTPDRQFPAAACMIQNQLKAENAFAFDISAGCSGFLYGLSLVNDTIRVGSCKNALVIGAERLSSITNWTDRGTCVLLADGAGAVVVSADTKKGGILSSHIQSDGSLWELLYSSYGNSFVPEILSGLDTKPFYLKMEGNRLFKRAVEYLTAIAEKALKENSLSCEDVALLVPHQANIRIIQAVAKNLNISMEKVFTNVEKYGNTSSASIPIALDEANRQGLLKKDDYLLLIAFGAGLTWASSMIRWSI